MEDKMQQIKTLKNKQKEIIEWFHSYIDSKFEKPFTEFINSSTYKEYLELEKNYSEWKDINTKISNEKRQGVFIDKYRVSRLLDKTQELRSKFQNIENLYAYLEELKHKIWDTFCKLLSEELDNHGVRTVSFPYLLFKDMNQKYICNYDTFKKIVLAKIMYFSKHIPDIIVNNRKKFYGNNIELSKLGNYEYQRLPYADWLRDENF